MSYVSVIYVLCVCDICFMCVIYVLCVCDICLMCVLFVYYTYFTGIAHCMGLRISFVIFLLSKYYIDYVYTFDYICNDCSINDLLHFVLFIRPSFSRK